MAHWQDKASAGILHKKVNQFFGQKLISLLKLKDCNAFKNEVTSNALTGSYYFYDSNLEMLPVKTVCSLTDMHALSRPKASNQILGYIDSVVVSGANVQVRGWSCEKSRSERTEVRIYAGDPLTQGVALTKLKAQVNNEAAVNRACGTSGTGHRFVASIPKSSLAKLSGTPVYAIGTSTRTDATGADLLISSGKFKIP